MATGASLKIKLISEDTDSQFDNQDEISTQYSMSNSPKSAYDPSHEPTFDSFSDSLYSAVESFLDAEGLFITNYDPISSYKIAKAAKPLLNLAKMNFMELKSRNSMEISTDVVKELGIRKLPSLMERRRKTLFADGAN